MNYHKMFDGTYADDDGKDVYEVRTTTNPAGFTVTSSVTCKTLYINIDDALDLADRLGLQDPKSGDRYITLNDLERKR